MIIFKQLLSRFVLQLGRVQQLGTNQAATQSRHVSQALQRCVVVVVVVVVEFVHTQSRASARAMRIMIPRGVVSFLLTRQATLHRIHRFKRKRVGYRWVVCRESRSSRRSVVVVVVVVVFQQSQAAC
jgi:hypothetical protein